MNLLCYRYFITVFCFIPLLFMSGCSDQQNTEQKTILRFAYASNSQPVIDSMQEFGRLIAEKTNGRITVEYYPDAQLGGEIELIELTQIGAIDFTKVSASALEGFSKDYAIFSVPYLFDSEEHFFNVMDNSNIMDRLYLSTEDLGFIGITYYNSGQRSFYMVEGPIKTPADLKGKKIRVMQSATAIKMVELLGGSPVPMGSSEVYTSMQANLIHGSENNEFVLFTAGHGGVAKYYSYDEHTRVPDIILMNKDSLNRLSREDQQAVLTAAKESSVFEKEIFHEAVEKEKQIATERYGVKYNMVDNSPFREMVIPLHNQFKENPIFKEIYLDIRGAAQGENNE